MSDVRSVLSFDSDYWVKFWNEYPKEKESKKTVEPDSQKESLVILANDNVEGVNVEISFKERVRVLVHNFSIEQEWAEVIAKLQSISKPNILSADKWLDIKYTLNALVEGQYWVLKTMISQGWTLEEIFGCHKIMPEKRFDFMGLFMLLRVDDKIIDISGSLIKLRKKGGAIQTFSHFIASNDTELVLIHEL